MRIFSIALITVMFGFLAGCGTTDSALIDSGHSETYIQGFHDGRHSGMREAGNNFEHYIRDEDRFGSDSDYRAGWLSGEIEGKQLQAQADAIGRTASGAYQAVEIEKEVDKSTDYDQFAKDAVKGVDTSSLNGLEN